jgi:hypothetical protein
MLRLLVAVGLSALGLAVTVTVSDEPLVVEVIPQV